MSLQQLDSKVFLCVKLYHILWSHLAFLPFTRTQSECGVLSVCRHGNCMNCNFPLPESMWCQLYDTYVQWEINENATPGTWISILYVYLSLELYICFYVYGYRYAYITTVVIWALSCPISPSTRLIVQKFNQVNKKRLLKLCILYPLRGESTWQTARFQRGKCTYVWYDIWEIFDVT